MDSRNQKVPAFEKIAEELAMLRDARSRTRYLARRRGCHRTQVLNFLIDSSRTNLRIDARKSLSLAEAAVAIARRLCSKDDLALAIRSKGNALSVLGDNQRALKHHSQARRLFRATGNSLQEARTLNASIQPHILLGEYDEAIDAAKLAETLFAKAGDERHLAHLQINIGNIYHRQDRFEQALASYQRAYEKLLPLKDSEGLAVALYNISVCLIALNDFPRALATYSQAREMCAREGMTLLVGQADYNIAYLYYLRGEYTRAVSMLCAAKQLSETNGDEHILALCHLDLSDIYLELNLTAEAAEFAHEGFMRFDKLGMGYEKAKCTVNEALAEERKRNTSRALDLFEEAREAFVEEHNTIWPSVIDLHRGLLLYGQGHFREARELCQRAIECLGQSTLKGKVILCWLLLARIDLEEGNPEDALSRCKQALRGLSKTDMPSLNYQANLLMGKIQRALDNCELAHSFLKMARQALETLRSGLHKDEFKIAFMAERSEVYESLVELCLESQDKELRTPEVFEYMEAAKSRALAELMCRDSQDAHTAQSEQNLQLHRIANLRAELNWYYHRIEQEQLRPDLNSSARIKKLKCEASDREKALARCMRDLPDSGDETAILRGQTSVPLKHIQDILKEDTLLVEYFTVGDRLLAALIRRREAQIREIPDFSDVLTSIQRTRFQMKKFSLGAEYISRFQSALLQSAREHLQDLYRRLIEPLGSLATVKHIVVVPHGELYSIPFHALFDGECYLIDRCSLSYAPSASIYRICHDRPSSSSDRSLIFGIPDQRAPFICEEVMGISSIVASADVLVGEQANEEKLREKGPKSSVIHIATHGNFRQDNPMFSRISLGQGYLTVQDLYELHLPADLVTLSGCATGLNAVASGDEPLGLMRGLLSAGAKSLLLTLWDVHDRSTSEFMKSFYRFLGEGWSKAQSVQQAAQKTRDLYPHPYYWAPFFLVGSALGGP